MEPVPGGSRMLCENLSLIRKGDPSYGLHTPLWPASLQVALRGRHGTSPPQDSEITSVPRAQSVAGEDKFREVLFKGELEKYTRGSIMRTLGPKC